MSAATVMKEAPVRTSTTVTVELNEPVANVDTSTFLVAAPTSVAGTVSAIHAARYVFSPSSALPSNTAITVTLTSGITDTAVSPNTLVTTQLGFTTGP